MTMHIKFFDNSSATNNDQITLHPGEIRTRDPLQGKLVWFAQLTIEEHPITYVCMHVFPIPDCKVFYHLKTPVFFI
jgi:hypothetical protein